MQECYFKMNISNLYAPELLSLQYKWEFNAHKNN